MENTSLDSFDEKKSLQVISEMIQVSRKKINRDGVLLMVWGYAMSMMYLNNYLKDILFYSQSLNRVISTITSLLPLAALGFTVFYIIRQRNKVTTYIGSSLRYIWVALIFSLVLINLILFNVMHEVNFTLQHPLFMVIISFATLVTGIILRFKIIIIGAIIYSGLAFVCSYLALRDQMLMDAIAWFMAFVVPGHLMFLKRNR